MTTSNEELLNKVKELEEIVFELRRKSLDKDIKLLNIKKEARTLSSLTDKLLKILEIQFTPGK